MSFSHNPVLTIIKIILLGLTILSTLSNINSAFFQGKTEIVSSTRNLSEMEFPVIFRLSVTGLLNITQIKKTHPSVGSYFNGIAEKTNPQFYWSDRNGSKSVQGSQLNTQNRSFSVIFFRNLRKYFEFQKYHGGFRENTYYTLQSQHEDIQKGGTRETVEKY